eukprot:1790751-Prymnesium_polylepis.1
MAWTVGRVFFGDEELRTSSALYGEVLAATGTYLAAWCLRLMVRKIRLYLATHLMHTSTIGAAFMRGRSLVSLRWASVEG